MGFKKGEKVRFTESFSEQLSPYVGKVGIVTRDSLNNYVDLVFDDGVRVSVLCGHAETVDFER